MDVTCLRHYWIRQPTHPWAGKFATSTVSKELCSALYCPLCCQTIYIVSFQFISFCTFQILSWFHFLTFHLDHISFWSYSKKSTFHFGHILKRAHSKKNYIPKQANSILITFHFGHIPKSTFHFGHIPKNAHSKKSSFQIEDIVFWYSIFITYQKGHSP